MLASRALRQHSRGAVWAAIFFRTRTQVGRVLAPAIFGGAQFCHLCFWLLCSTLLSLYPGRPISLGAPAWPLRRGPEVRCWPAAPALASLGRVSSAILTSWALFVSPWFLPFIAHLPRTTDMPLPPGTSLKATPTLKMCLLANLSLLRSSSCILLPRLRLLLLHRLRCPLQLTSVLPRHHK